MLRASFVGYEEQTIFEIQVSNAKPAIVNFQIGGAPNENRFYLDDVEVPNINHFATQGSSGGPVGLINVNFIKEVDFYSGAFPANRGNALSSVMNFRQADGRDDRIGGTFLMGSSDFGVTLEGPVGDKTTFLVSARRSYLQFLFQALGLPFLPTYNDFQTKIKHKIDQKNEIYLPSEATALKKALPVGRVALVVTH